MAMEVPSGGGSRQRTNTPSRLNSRVVVCTAALLVAKRMGKTIGARSIATTLLHHLAANRRGCGSRNHRVGGKLRCAPQLPQRLLVVERAAGDALRRGAADLHRRVGEDLRRAPFRRRPKPEKPRR